MSGCGIRQQPTSRVGIHAKSNSYFGGCVFIDAATGYIDIQLQSYLSADEKISAVSRFEVNVLDNGIIISQYQSDNGGAFPSKAFKDHLLSQGQTNRFSGAGSHHQNGRAERAIRTIMEMGRTILLHSAIHWSDVTHSTLWPFAVKHAVWIFNRLPRTDTGGSPMNLWSKSRLPISKLHSLHVFGCPAYVLQKRIADEKKMGRWQPRSER